MFGKFFGKKVSGVKQELAKIENRDLMQAIVWGGLLIAHADGECEDSEITSLDNVIQALPELQGFGSEIGKTIDSSMQTFKAGKTTAKIKAMREIEDLKASNDDKELCFGCLIDIAQADGEIEEAEVKVLKEIGQKLGVRLSDFGIE